MFFKLRDVHFFQRGERGHKQVSTRNVRVRATIFYIKKNSAPEGRCFDYTTIVLPSHTS